MTEVGSQQIEMIPISRINVLNPRSRNKRQHREIVNNIEAIGLKRPITVSLRQGPGGPRYDLVCGQGRLDPDPISAGTMGEAALWGGSSMGVGMAANPLGAH